MKLIRWLFTSIALFVLGMTVPSAAQDAPRCLAKPKSDGVSLKQCRIVVPDSTGLQKAASGLARLLREHGSTVAVIKPSEVMDESGLRWRGSDGETTILVGSLANNRAFLPLYGAVLDFTDAYYPGGDGYVVRTVVDWPHPGHNTIVLGGSSEAGVVRAVNRFSGMVSALKSGQPFPLTLDVRLGGEALKSLGSASIPADISSMGYLYGLTGEERFAKSAKSWFEKRVAQGTLKENEYTQNDYNIEQMIRGWALLCDSPEFSANEVQAINQLFLNLLISSKDEYWRAYPGEDESKPGWRISSGIGGRHQTMGNSSFLATTAFLLRRAAPDDKAGALLKLWKSDADLYFNLAIKTFHDDTEGITGYYSVQPIANYALENGIADYFKRSTGRSTFETAVLRACVATDNLGYYCGAGNYEEARPGKVKSDTPLGYPLALATCVNGDSGAAWMLKNFPGTTIDSWARITPYGTHCFDMGGSVGQIAPESLLGVVRVPLGEYRYSLLPHAADPAHPEKLYLPCPIERTVEKICFRDSLNPTGQYMLIQGYQDGRWLGYYGWDANSILRYTDRGVVWLISNVEQLGNLYRNGVYVSDGEKVEPGWSGVDVIGETKAGDAHLVVSRLGNYSGSQWTRNILWLRGRAFGVLDKIRFEKPGERQVFCTYRSYPYAELKGREWIARSGNAVFRLLNADDVAMTSRCPGQEGGASPTVLREARSLKASSGDTVMFRNMFYVSDPDRPQQFKIKPVGKNGLLMLDAQRKDGCPGLLAVNDGKGLIHIGPFISDAEAIYVGPEGACIVGGSRLTCGGEFIALGGNAPLPQSAIRSLKSLWRESRAAVSSEKQSKTTPIKPIWRFDEMTPRRPVVPSPVVSASEPPNSGSLNNMIDGDIPLWFGDATWWNPKGLTLTFDLRRVEDISSIEWATAMVAAIDALPTPSQIPDKPVTVEFSDDNFHEDIRGGSMVFRGGFTIEPLHKGSVFAMGRWRLSNLSESGRWVRLTFPAGPVALREVIIRRSSGTDARFRPSLVADLDGDKKQEIVVTTDNNELMVLGSDGKKRWNHIFDGPVTCLKEASFPQGRVLLVGTWEARLYCFSTDGKLLWQTHFHLDDPDRSVPFSIALLHTKPNEPPTVIVGNYFRVCFVSTDGELLSYSQANPPENSLALTDGLELTGDGVEDALLFNSWTGMSIIDGAKRTMLQVVNCPSGDGLYLKRWPDATQDDPGVLVAAQNGIALLHPKSGKNDWRIDMTPLSCVTTADLDGDGHLEIIAGRRDGWLLILSDDGKVRSKTIAGSNVRSVVTLPSYPGRIWVATDTDIRLLNTKLTTRATYSLEAQRIEPLGKDALLAFGIDGSVSVLPDLHE